MIKLENKNKNIKPIKRNIFLNKNKFTYISYIIGSYPINEPKRVAISFYLKTMPK